MVPQLRRIGCHRLVDRGQRGQIVIVHQHRRCRRTRRLARVRHYERHRIADKAHMALRQHWARCGELAHHHRGHRFEMREIGCGQHQHNAGHRSGFPGIDRGDPCVAVGRPHRHPERHARKLHIVRIGAVPGNQAPVFEALLLACGEFEHVGLRRSATGLAHRACPRDGCGYSSDTHRRSGSSSAAARQASNTPSSVIAIQTRASVRGSGLSVARSSGMDAIQ